MKMGLPSTTLRHSPALTRARRGTGLGLFLASVVFGAAGCHASSEQSKMPGFTDAEVAALQDLTLASSLPAPVDPTNGVLSDPERLPLAEQLGHRLFFETRFAGPLLDPDHKDSGSAGLGVQGDVGKIACASCHVPTSGFQDTRSPREALSLGAGWTPRKAISLLNVSFSRLLMWDGRHDALWNQIFTPLEKHFELNSGRLFVAQQVARDETYKATYEELFGPLPDVLNESEFPLVARPGCLLDSAGNLTDCHGMPGDGAEYDSLDSAKKDAVTLVVVNLGKALHSYERHIRCGVSRFDSFMNGESSALSEQEQRGARLFVGKANCASCHGGPFFTDHQFHNVGLEPGGPQVLFMTRNDPGAKQGVLDLMRSPVNAVSVFSDDRSQRRFGATVPASYDGAFKTPSLRCASKRPSFFHTGQYVSLEDIVSFKNRGGHKSGYAGVSELEPLNLTAEEQADLVAFLKSLDELPGTGTPARYQQAP